MTPDRTSLLVQGWSEKTGCISRVLAQHSRDQRWKQHHRVFRHGGYREG